MSRTSSVPDGPHSKIVHTLLDTPRVTFSRNTLWLNRKMFAYCSPKGQLVFKLPKERVEELIGEKKGEPFASSKNKFAPEWLIVGPDHQKDWLSLAREAMKFVASKQ